MITDKGIYYSYGDMKVYICTFSGLQYSMGTQMITNPIVYAYKINLNSQYQDHKNYEYSFSGK